MDLQGILAEAAYICVSIAVIIFFFKVGRRMKKGRRDLDQLEKTLEENKPEGFEND